MHTNCYLSIISPFYNSKEKCTRLLVTLSKIDDPEVEIIFVDDGSTDGTYDLLQNYVRENTNVKLYKQENKGPGGARNEGLKHANGKYVWFVDSDDDIQLEAIQFLKEKQHLNYDFIDFDFSSIRGIINTMEIPYGEYKTSQSISVKEILLKNFGNICTKMILRELLVDNKIYYPEYCIFEDNPQVFIYPFFVRKFLKTDLIGYNHHVEFESVTRGSLSPRYFDRLYTTIYALNRGSTLVTTSEDLKILQEKVIRIYLFNTVAQIFFPISLERISLILRLMKHYRDIAKEKDITINPLGLRFSSLKYKALFTMLWICSFSIVGEQTKFFDDIRIKAWGKPFIEPLY